MDVIKSSLNTVFMIIALMGPGILLVICKRKEKLGKVLLVAGFLFLSLLSFTPFSSFLLWNLESKYPPLLDPKKFSEAKYIVLLTAWDSSIDTIPFTSNLGYRSAFRTLEAYRIYKEIPSCKIIISGNRVSNEMMSRLLGLLSVPKNDIVFDRSENTAESAKNIKDLVGGQKFILLTSAIHLVRAMNYFVAAGLDPIPAPADYLYGYYPRYHFPLWRPIGYYLPNTDSFMRSSAALYEYFGLVKMKFLKLKSGKQISGESSNLVR